MIVTLDDKNSYKATVDGKPVDFKLRNGSALEFTFDGKIKKGVLKIEIAR